jgi:prepilin-type N-terminal cleavage/methylation domain-containing protein
MRIFRSCLGFTLIELMVTLALLGLVIAGGLSFYFFADRSFMSGSEMADVQADVQLAMRRITDEVRLAHSLELITRAELPDVIDDDDKDDHYLFSQGGTIFLKTIESPPDRVILNSIADEPGYDVSFGRVSGSGEDFPDMLAITISSQNPQVNYELSSELQVLNLRSTPIKGSGSSEVIRFTKNLTKETLEPFENRRCPYLSFVYPSDAPQLAHLRDFRDNYLAKNLFGRFVIQVYYSSAPVVNSFLEHQPLARTVTTTFLRSLAEVVIRVT